MIGLDNHGRFLLLGSVLVGMHFSIVSRNSVSQFDQDAPTSPSTMTLDASACDRISLARSKSAKLYLQIFLGAWGAAGWVRIDIAAESNPLWSELPIGGMVSQLLTSSGDEDSIRSIVVADELVTHVWPVGMSESMLVNYITKKIMQITIAMR